MAHSVRVYTCNLKVSTSNPGDAGCFGWAETVMQLFKGLEVGLHNTACGSNCGIGTNMILIVLASSH